MFVTVDLAELDDDQRRWLPDPIPEDLRVMRCTACGQMRAEIPERGIDPWKNHDDECAGEPDEDDDDR